jgi:hypothetical protein
MSFQGVTFYKVQFRYSCRYCGVHHLPIEIAIEIVTYDSGRWIATG